LGLSKLFPGSMYGENLGVDGRMIIIVVREKSWSIWFRIGTNGGLLKTRLYVRSIDS